VRIADRPPQHCGLNRRNPENSQLRIAAGDHGGCAEKACRTVPLEGLRGGVTQLSFRPAALTRIRSVSLTVRSQLNNPARSGPPIADFPRNTSSLVIRSGAFRMEGADAGSNRSASYAAISSLPANRADHGQSPAAPLREPRSDQPADPLRARCCQITCNSPPPLQAWLYSPMAHGSANTPTAHWFPHPRLPGMGATDTPVAPGTASSAHHRPDPHHQRNAVAHPLRGSYPWAGSGSAR
jgi:hypothetical protein